MNPVNGAVGLMLTGNWHVCQAAVESVLRGGSLKPIPEFLSGESLPDDASDCTNIFQLQRSKPSSGHKPEKRRRLPDEASKVMQLADLDLSLTPRFHGKNDGVSPGKLRLGSPSMNSEESVTTACGDRSVNETRLLNLFN